MFWFNSETTDPRSKLFQLFLGKLRGITKIREGIWSAPERLESAGNAIGTGGNHWQRSLESVKSERRDVANS